MVSLIWIWGNPQGRTAKGVPDNIIQEAGCPSKGHNRHNLSKLRKPGPAKLYEGSDARGNYESTGQAAMLSMSRNFWKQQSKTQQRLNHGLFFPSKVTHAPGLLEKGETFR